jgi:hypothetical protein
VQQPRPPAVVCQAIASEAESSVSFLDADPDPPLGVSCGSHVELTSSDLAEPKQFSTEARGLVVSAEPPETLYRRGLRQ